MKALAKTMRFSKIWNLLLLWSGFQLSRLFRKPIHWGWPSSIAIEPTTSCNLRCPECPSGLRSFTRPTGMLQAEDFEQTIIELKPWLSYLTFYFQGEPFLNPRFLDLVSVAVQHRIYTSTSTNAHYLKSDVARKTVESGLHRIIISIDGTTQETYEQYRVGGSLDKVLEGTKNLVTWKKALQSETPHIIFQFLVVKPNEHQIKDLYQLAEEMGVDEVKLKTAQIYDYTHGSDLIPENAAYSRYEKQNDDTYQIKNPMDNQCWTMWKSCVVTWDGKVVPCCFDKDALHVLGNTRSQKFSTIWKSEAYRQFRSAILRSRKEIDICTNCTEGMKIWA